MIQRRFSKRAVQQTKAITVLVAVVASIMLTFGGMFWSVGLALLVTALCVRFAMASISRPSLEVLPTSEVKFEAPQERFSPNKPLNMFAPHPAKILVIGVGGAGCNAIKRMVREQLQGVQFVAMNTDSSGLARCEAPVRLLLGEKLTGGKGASGDHKLGQKAVEESRDEIKTIVDGADMVFLTAGMGGGTGTGAAPIVAEIAKQSGAVTIAVVTKPFTFEGRVRSEVAEEGIFNLLGKVDTLIIIPNDRLLDLCDHKTTVDSAFKMADDVLRQGVQAISDIITVPGLINLDFADVKAVLKDAGPAWLSTGTGTGPNRAAKAAMAALASPLLDVTVEQARAVVFNIVGSSNLTLSEVNEAAEIIRRAVDPNGEVIYGVAHDPRLKDEVRIALIATGFITKREPTEPDKLEAEIRRLLRGLERQDKAKFASSGFATHPSEN